MTVGYTAVATMADHCQFCKFYNATVCSNPEVALDPAVPKNANNQKIVSPVGWCREFITVITAVKVAGTEQLQKPYASDSDVPSYVPKKNRAQWRAIWNKTYDEDISDGKSKEDAESHAFQIANGVAGPNAAKKFAKLLAKATEEDARTFSDALIAKLEADYAALPAEVRDSIESAMLSGVGQGMLQIDVSNAALLRSANTVAHDYAVHRAAELIGRKYDAEGELIENPNAKWAISETTRDKIRGIVADAFLKETSMEDIKDSIQKALSAETEGNGIFSNGRADMIAHTEVSNAQARGNYTVWRDSGVVKKIRWTTSDDEKVCSVCDGNDQHTVDIGQPFPDGSLYPGAHPNCRCVAIVVETSAS